MYHIRKDKRSAQSAELIYEGLRQCLAHKSFGQITVTDVQKASGVARTTIYRCFDNLSDILYWRCDLAFREALPGIIPEEDFSEWALIRQYFAYWTRHSDILELLLEIGRQDILYSCHMKYARQLEEAHGSLPGLDKTSARYFLAVRTGVTIGVLKTWLEEGRKETPEELTAIVKAVSPMA